MVFNIVSAFFFFLFVLFFSWISVVLPAWQKAMDEAFQPAALLWTDWGQTKVAVELECITPTAQPSIAGHRREPDWRLRLLCYGGRREFLYSVVSRIGLICSSGVPGGEEAILELTRLCVDSLRTAASGEARFLATSITHSTKARTKFSLANVSLCSF